MPGSCAVVNGDAISNILLQDPPDVYVVKLVVFTFVPSTSVSSNVFVVLFATINVLPFSSVIPPTLVIIT